MGKMTPSRLKTMLSGHFAIRLLIISYFVAIALGLISGTDLSVLAQPFVSATAASIVSGICVVGLSAMILFNLQRRVAALLLAILLFWCSYLTLMSPVGSQNIENFWRDLVLIGALLLTYADAGTDSLAPDYGTLPQGGELSDTGNATKPTYPNSSRVNRRGDRVSKTLYREDLDIARVT